MIFRISANRTVPKHEPFFDMLKTLIWWNLLDKRKPYRDGFLYEKALQTEIYAVCIALTA
jgi:hypothetical protein